MKKTKATEKVSPQEKSSSNPGGEKVVSGAPAIESKEAKNPDTTKSEPKEIPSEITLDGVRKTLNDMNGITVVGNDKYRGPLVKAGNKNLFSLLDHKGDKGVTIRVKTKKGKYSYKRHRIEKPKDLKHWYDLAKEEAKKVEA